MDEPFSKDTVGFWGAVASGFWFGTSLVKYFTMRKASKNKDAENVEKESNEMSEHDLAKGELGKVGQYEVEVKDGKFHAEIKASQFGISCGAFVEIDSDIVMDAIAKAAAKAIPGTIDDQVINGALPLIKAMLKNV